MQNKDNAPARNVQNLRACTHIAKHVRKQSLMQTKLSHEILMTFVIGNAADTE